MALYNVTVESPNLPAPPANLDDIMIEHIKQDIENNPNGDLAQRQALGTSVQVHGRYNANMSSMYSHIIYKTDYFVKCY